VKQPTGTLEHCTDSPVRGPAATTVLVAVESARVREALVAMLGAVEGFNVVAEAGTDEAALAAARSQRPGLALVEAELSGGGGCWVMQQICAEHLASAVVALGRRADSVLAHMVGARVYVQMGTAPRDLLSALEAAVSIRVTGGSITQTEHDLLSDANPVI